MPICNVRFDLTEARVNRLFKAGVASLGDLAKVLAALDLRAKIELCEVDVTGLTAKPQEEETT